MLSNREQKISQFVDNIITQKKWEEENKKHINMLKDKYNKELDIYNYINSIDELKLGGYIRYINNNDELRWGGILKKIINNKFLIISNKSNDLITISFDKNYIFYRNHVTYDDSIRDLFITSLDKWDNN
jgi:hypothetical protein